MNQAKKRAKAKTKDQWLAVIKQCQCSLLPISKFASQNNIVEGCLYYWSKRLGVPLKNKQSDTTIEFIQLPSLPPQTEQTERYFLEIKTSQLTITTKASWNNVIELVRGLHK